MRAANDQLVPSLQALRIKVFSPKLTCTIMEPDMRADLHPPDGEDGKDAGQANLCAKFAGSRRIGMALDRWLVRKIRWLVTCAIVSAALEDVFPSSVPARIAQGLGFLLTAAPLGLCLRASVVQSLPKLAGTMYYLVSISAGRIADLFIYGRKFWIVDGEVDASRAAVYCAGKVAFAMLLIIGIALQDAIPLRVFPQRMQVLTFAFAAVY